MPEIDPFYKPIIKLDLLLGQVYKLTPNSPSLCGIATKILENLDNNSGKKTLFAVV